MKQIISMFPEQFEERMQEARKWERERIIKLLQQIHDTWEKPTSFSYRNELRNIIKLIESKND